MELAALASRVVRLGAALSLGVTLASCGGETADPGCLDADCIFPPQPTCIGDQRVSYLPFGSCLDGACDYAPANTVDCEYGCADGECLDAPDLCEGVTCENPPADACEADVAVTFAPSGTCDDGECAYEQTRIECRTSGLRCRDGECVDVCEDAECVEPPAPTCDGDVAVVAAATGTCIDEQCSYEESRTDCAATAQACVDGACVDVIECPGTCDLPPEATCSGNTAISWSELGECDAETGECIYERTQTNCSRTASVCIDGECIFVDPCAGISCQSPPAPTCDDGVAVNYAAPGVCDDGECSYSESVDDCEARDEYCFAGACQDFDPCSVVSCDTPPAARCDDGVAITYAVSGTCSAGECDYADSRTDCAALGQFCSAGRCVAADPCEGVVCDNPPADSCDGNNAQQYEPLGVCDGGICRYQPTDINCLGVGRFCDDGVCVVDDPCDGVACDAAPAGRCEGSVAIAYPAVGACSGGDCSYTETRTNCAATGGFCQDGVCLAPDPCRSVSCDSPPAPRCNGDTLISFAAGGTCSGGLCRYAESRDNCAAVAGGYCLEGACAVTDPCVGRACSTPPAASCDGNTALRYSLPGLCADGVCNYTLERIDCEAQDAYCAAGQCVGTDPCLSVTCGTPPTATCDGDTAVTYAAPGTCANGRCDYVATRSDCAADGGFCNDGACQSVDPCLGINCLTPPDPFCDGGIAVGFANTGTCAAGECDYDEVRTNCSARGQFCFDGFCQATDPCEGVTCNAPPASMCNGDRAVDYNAVGTCVAGECAYGSTSIDCAALTGFCFDGDCVATELCDDVTCDSPTFSAYCDGNLLVRPSTPGSCRAGTCAYAQQTVDCGARGEFCFAGACQAADPCLTTSCDAPPTDRCNGDIAVVYSRGTCSLGACDYEPQLIDCAASGQYCSAGACADIDPCLGVDCNSPPGAFCDGNTVVSYSTDGTCSDGVCSYAQQLNSCAATGRFCLNGRCQLNNPCTGVACNRPPAPACDGDVAVSYATSGTCEFGLCSYAPLRTDCGALGGYCDDGVCAGLGLCDGVSCNDPPADFCDGNAAVAFNDGVCRAGSCEYGGQVTDCGVLGATCVAGRCIAPDACDGVACDAPPADFCDADVAVQHIVPGSCSLGACTFATARVDCAAQGRYCSGGDCVDADPCLGVVCLTPNEPFCDGNTVVSYGATGECISGSCRYDEVRTSCGSLFCNGGACQPTDPCAGISCNRPPAAFCDGDTRVTYAAGGTCAEGDCSYRESREDCGAVHGGFCFDAACGTYDLCEFVTCDNPPRAVCNGPGSVLSFANPGTCSLGVCDYVETVRACNTPPANVCDGNVAIRYSASGTCSAGVCSYNPQPVDCGASGQFCSNGTCQNVDPCLGLTCNTPDAAFCDGNTVVSYTSPGTCSSGECSYGEVRTNCRNTNQYCAAGACQATDPCAGVSCSVAPAPVCDGAFAVTFSAGTCTEGECDFVETRTNCATVAGGYCAAGACLVANPCEGVSCNNPPANVCDGPSAVLRYSSTGTCGVNGCTYGSTRVSCNTPPADTCDGLFAIDYSVSGTCAGGACTYSFARTDCAARGQICDGGRCADYDRCAGVACDTPPGTFCDGQTAVSWQTPGSCAAGVCDYDEVRTDCRALGRYCLGGACVPNDPCAGVNCTRPPADFCDLDDAVIFEVSGECSEGICRYDSTRTACDSVANGYCLGGDCLVGDPCAGLSCNNPPAPTCVDGVLTTYLANGTCGGTGCTYPSVATVCDAPPEATCDGDVAVAYAATGSCASGSCSYAATRTDCAAQGKYCGGGQCLDADPCLGLNCLTPPDPFCDGNTAVDHENVGVCEAGVCSYAQVRSACAGATPYCDDGACVAADPCAGIACTTPPEPTCEGATAVFYTGAGACSEGDCFYGRVTDDCDAIPGGFCIDGACESSDPCSGINCINPPPSTCSGGSVVRYGTAGSCSLGECSYSSTVVPCNTPPADYCEVNVAVRWGAGACSGGECAYAQTRTDCAVTGRVCDLGACVADPCAGVDCSVAPAPLCEGDVAVSFGAFGTCTAGDCSFTRTTTDCAANGLRCRNGACYAPSPCDSVSCNSPPAPTCLGTVAYSYAANGICNNGSCTYPSAQLDCATFGFGGSCIDGACESADPCEGVACNEPPDAFCVGETLYAFATPGLCQLGACSYVQTARDCTLTDEICDNGACVPDPCSFVTCNSPPASYCTSIDADDGNNIRATATAPGVCTDGECTYPEFDGFDCRDIGLVCFNGACVESVDPPPCTAASCLTPPPPTCVGNSVISFSTPGVCVEGVGCEWVENTVDCGATGEFCVGGSCADTCSGNVCDGSVRQRCITGTNRLRIVTAGTTCSGGLCDSTYEEFDCASIGQFCANDACQATDPCIGVVCPTREASPAFCDGTVRVSAATAGTCVGQSCVYPDQRFDCASIDQACVNGECTDAPCDLIACDERPPFCDSLGRAVETDGPGVCIAATLSCDYSGVETVTDCALSDQVCQLGACVDTVVPIAPDTVQIVELMVDPFGADTGLEWIEIRNPTTSVVDLAGARVTVTFGSGEDIVQRDFTFAAGSSLAPGEQIVIGTSAAAAPVVDHVWSIASAELLPNDTASIVISFGTTNVDFITYDTALWGIAAGRAVQFDTVNHTDNVQSVNWCVATDSYATNQYGTPGGENIECPAAP